MRKIGHKIAKPDFAGFFTADSRPFHWLFMAFSRFLHGVMIFANEVAPSIFQAIGYLWGLAPC